MSTTYGRTIFPILRAQLPVGKYAATYTDKGVKLRRYKIVTQGKATSKELQSVRDQLAQAGVAFTSVHNRNYVRGFHHPNGNKVIVETLV